MSKKNLMEKLRARLKGENRTEEFLYDSEDMRQIPFKFFANDYDSRIKDADEIRRDNFVKTYFDMSCGYLHLGWDIDAFWTKVAEQAMIPHVKAIHQELVRLGHDESNPCMYGDADGTMYWLPAEDPNTMVLMHENQSRDYLYVCTELKSKHGLYPSTRWNFHIRRVWRKYQDQQNSWQVQDMKNLHAQAAGRKDHLDNTDLSAEYLASLSKDKLIKVIQTAQNKRIDSNSFIESILKRVDSHEELADDHYEYSKRHSLEYYKERGFKFRYHGPFKGIYCDGRDGGYVMSMNSSTYSSPRAENLVQNFHLLQLIATCYLPSMANQLNLNVDEPWTRKNE
jgi:hypothetical protein